ncbi:transcriptional regulator, AraC family [Brucella sp. 10RB9215]|uniref:helix-turn-helix domain-containing protein n=1 Tax=Brucella sp. 10RB9215 TaxID=1149953 RepID=UPI00090C26C3|nr:helix-turn-helix domain-containing protein [Brucella sp. 10RB9215]SBW16431.1 transcriptional regulator, AraC family [Brucella sp. 10RB9215]
MTNNAFFSTDMVESRFRNDLLRAAMKPMYEIIMDPSDRSYELSGSAKLHASGLITIGTTTFNTQSYARTPKIIAQGGLDFYVLQLLTGGHLLGDFDGTDVAAKPGDIVIIDMAKTLVSRAFKGSRTTVFIPRAELEEVVGGRNLHGLVLSGTRPITRLLFNYIQELNAVVPDLSMDEAIAAQKVMLTFLRTGITGLEEDLTGFLPVNLPMKKRILSFIDQNLSDPLLGPRTIIQNFHVSRSHLYRAFENDGGVAKTIRDKRLDRAFRILAEERDRTVYSKEVAYRCGFNDPAQFASAFKNRFGMSPRDVQASGATLLSLDVDGFSFPKYISQEIAKVVPPHS